MYKHVKVNEPFQLVSNTGGDEPITIGFYNPVPSFLTKQLTVYMSPDGNNWGLIFDLTTFKNNHTGRYSGYIVLAGLTPGCYLKISAEGVNSFNIIY